MKLKINFRRKRIFISVPITGFEDTYQDRLTEAKNKLISIFGINYSLVEIITPMDIDYIDEHDEAKCIGQCISELLTCDTLVSLSGWEKSRGCRTERFVAETYGLDLLTFDDEINS